MRTRPQPPGSHAPRGLAAGVLTAALLSGCAGLPQSGPVQAGPGAAPTSAGEPFEYNPPSPRLGAPPDEIVSGFLSAQQAIPVSTQVAEEFLTPEAAERWRPDKQTIIYASQRLVTDGRSVVLRLRGASALDTTGRWKGAWEGGKGHLDLRLTRKEGEWRIANPPPALIIPRSHFDARYRALSLFFFDPTGSVLVPEPVYLPTGVQAATLLVEGLLAGPPASTGEIERSYLPAATDLGVSVPVRQDRLAEVPLSAEILDLGPGDLTHALAQVAWTLRQLPEVAEFQLTVDGAPVGLPGGESIASVTGWEEYSPGVDWASDDLFGLRGRAIVRVTGGAESTVARLPEPLIEEYGRPASIGVSLSGDQTAVLTGDASTAYLVTSREGSTPRPQQIYEGTSLLRPMWDRAGRLWILDRTANGSSVAVINQGTVTQLGDRWLERHPVSAAALSRDGTRLATVTTDEAGEDRIVVFRVVRDSLGQPTRLVRGASFPVSGSKAPPVAIAWSSPRTIAVMSRPSSFATRVQLISCDGAAVPTGSAPRLDVLFEPGAALASSPGTDRGILVGTESGGLEELTPEGRWQDVSLPETLRGPVFVG